MTKPRVQLVLIITLIVAALSLLWSQTAGPNLPTLFNLKRIQEKTFLKLKANPAEQVDYLSNLLNIRLQEMQDLVKNQDYHYVLPTSLRYSALAGQLTDLVINNHLTTKVEALRNQFLTHQKTLDNLYVIYPKNIEGNEEYKYIQDDYNYLKLYLNKLANMSK